MNPTTRVFAYFGTEVDPTAYPAPAGNAVVTIKVANARKKVVIRSFHSVRKTGGSATNNRPRIGQVSTFVADDFNQRWRHSAAVAPATAIHAEGLELDAVTDDQGRLFLVMDGDAADTFKWELGVEVLT